MRHRAGLRYSCAFVATTIFGFYCRYIHMTDDIAKHGYILSDKQTIDLRLIAFILIKTRDRKKKIKMNTKYYLLAQTKQRERILIHLKLKSTYFRQWKPIQFPCNLRCRIARCATCKIICAVKMCFFLKWQNMLNRWVEYRHKWSAAAPPDGMQNMKWRDMKMNANFRRDGKFNILCNKRLFDERTPHGYRF